MGSISPASGLEALRLRSPDGPIQTRARVRLPKAVHSEPVISNLISRHNLTVNITGALLGVSGQEDGWFDLQLEGDGGVISDALLALIEIGADVWLEGETEEDF